MNYSKTKLFLEIIFSKFKSFENPEEKKLRTKMKFSTPLSHFKIFAKSHFYQEKVKTQLLGYKRVIENGNDKSRFSQEFKSKLTPAQSFNKKFCKIY